MRCPLVPLEAVLQRSSVRCRPGKPQPGLEAPESPQKVSRESQKVSRQSPDSPIMILSQQASGSQPLSPIPHRMAWLKSYAARLSILNPARSVKFLTLGRPSTRDRRGDLPQRVSTGFLSPHRCVQMLPKLIRQDIKKLLGFYKIVAGHVCAQLGGKNIILLETIVQVQQAVRWNRNVSMLSLDTAGIFKTTFFGFPTNYFCFTSVSQFCDQIKTILKLPLVIKLNTIYLLECFCMETCSKTAEVHCWDKLL